jgi:hypothetical protein
VTPDERAENVIRDWMPHLPVYKANPSLAPVPNGTLKDRIAAEIREAVEEAREDAIQWVRARARDCGCSAWIEEKIRGESDGETLKRIVRDFTNNRRRMKKGAL